MTLRTVIVKKITQSSSMWFESLVHGHTASILYQLACQNPVYDVPQCSLSASDERSIPYATADELRKHTFVPSKTRGESRKKVRRSFHWGSKRLSPDFQGFILFKTENAAEGVYPQFVKPEEMDEWTSVFHDRLPALLRTSRFAPYMATIFARVAGNADYRMGDKRRGQVKFSRLLKVAKSQVKAAESKLRNSLPETKTDVVADRQKKLAAAQDDLNLIVLAKNLVARHYKRVVEVRQLSECHWYVILISAIFLSSFALTRCPPRSTPRTSHRSSRLRKAVWRKKFIWMRGSRGGRFSLR